jgi:predicted dehydrogenase
MMFNVRTLPLFRKMRELVKSGEFGEIRRTSWLMTDWYRSQCYYDSGSWRATWAGEGGGVLLNQCPHNLDIWQWICGMPVKVSAKMHFGKWHDIEVEDDVTAFLEFENGATGVFVTTTGDAPGTNRLEITGSLGKAVCEDDELTFWRNAEDERTWCTSCKEGFRKPDCQMTRVETDGLNPQHPAVLNAFAAHILRGEPLVADGREGLRGLMLSNAMHLSSWLGKAVTLPIDEELFHQLLTEKCRTSRRKEERDITMQTEGSY